MSAPQYGRAFVFGDSVNTDALAPGGLMKHPIAVIASHCLESVDPSFASTVRPGDVVVAGKGFGIGSGGAGPPALKISASRRTGTLVWRHFLSQRAQPRAPVLGCDDVQGISAGDLVHVDAATGVTNNRTREFPLWSCCHHSRWR